MGKITELTEEQKTKLDEYAKKWIGIGTNTDRINKKEAIQLIENIYVKILGREKPKSIIFTDSPYMAWNTIILLSQFNGQFNGQVGEQVDEQVREQVNEQVWEQVWEQVREQVGGQVGEQVWEQVREQVREQVWAQVMAQVSEQVWEQVNAHVRNQVGIQVVKRVSRQVNGQVDEQVREQVGKQVWEQVGEHIYGQVWCNVKWLVVEKVWNQVNKQVKKQVLGHVIEQVYKQVNHKVGTQVGDKVWMRVFEQVNEQVSEQVREQVWEQVGKQLNKKVIIPYMIGSFDATAFSNVDYYINCLGLKLSDELLELFGYYQQTSNLGYIYTLNDVCVVSEKPTKIVFKNGVLHSESEAAIQYADGFSVYVLNGVRVSKEIVETPWDKLDSRLLFTENNAEIRREIVRKIGIEKVCKDLKAEIIDRDYMYELLLLDIRDNVKRPYLKMMNPSIGCYHIEGVTPECRTITEALHSRKPLKMREIPVSDDGEDWYQQGDVCVWPEHAKKLKPKPCILT